MVLRDVLRDPRIPRSVRRTLSVEAGTNDIVVLPALLVPDQRPCGAAAPQARLQHAEALQGGLNAWRSHDPVEPT